MGQRLDAILVLADDRPRGQQAPAQPRVPDGVLDVEAAADDRNRATPGLERCAMRGCIDAHRKPRNDPPTRAGKGPCELPGRVDAGRRRSARAHDSDAPRLGIHRQPRDEETFRGPDRLHLVEARHPLGMARRDHPFRDHAASRRPAINRNPRAIWTCAACTTEEPARSATVRATRNARLTPLPDSFSGSIIRARTSSAAGSTAAARLNSWRGAVAFVTSRRKRWCWRLLAFSTRSFTDRDDSSARVSNKSDLLRRLTDTC